MSSAAWSVGAIRPPAAPSGTDLRAIYRTFLRRNLPPRGRGAADVRGRPALPLDRRAAAARGRAGHQLRHVDGHATARCRANARAPPAPCVSWPCPWRWAGGRRGTFVVLNFTRAEREEVDESVRIIALVNLSVLLLASLAGWLVAGRVLAPLRELRRTARADHRDGPDRPRIDVARATTSWPSWSGTFNEMLDRLERRLATQRAFVDDASHELRTPITIVRGHLELMGDDPGGARARPSRWCKDELDRMSRHRGRPAAAGPGRAPRLPAAGDGAPRTSWRRSCWPRRMALGPRDWRCSARRRGTLSRRPPAPDPGGDATWPQNAVQHTAAGDRIEIGVARSDGTRCALWVRRHRARASRRRTASGCSSASPASSAAAPLRGRRARAGDRQGHRRGPRRDASERASQPARSAIRDHLPMRVRELGAGSMNRILIAEDEPRLASLPGEGAARRGLHDHRVADGRRRPRCLARDDDFDLLILDLGLPGIGRFRGAARDPRGAASDCR